MALSTLDGEEVCVVILEELNLLEKIGSLLFFNTSHDELAAVVRLVLEVAELIF